MTRWVNLVLNECMSFHIFSNRTRTNLEDCSLFPVSVDRFARYGNTLPKHHMKNSKCPNCKDELITHAMYCASGTSMAMSHPVITFACLSCVMQAIEESYMGEELYHANEVAVFGRKVTWGSVWYPEISNIDQAWMSGEDRHVNRDPILP